MIVSPCVRLQIVIDTLKPDAKEKTMEKIDQNKEAAHRPLAFRRTVVPKVVSLANSDVIKTEYFNPDYPLPLVVKPNLAGLNLCGWLRKSGDFVQANLSRYGALLFRGFDLGTQEDFANVLEATSLNLMNYMESATPRIALGNGIYTSTEYPADQTIALHNELSTSHCFPMRVLFYCIQPAEEGGETPIADVRRVFNRIPAKIREWFIEKGWMLIRNYGNGCGPSWQQSFHTDEKSLVEEYCRSADTEFEWKGGDRLRTRQVRPAVLRSRETREMAWFNHVAFWHVSGLDPQVREAMTAIFKEEELPYNTYYGDGSRIDDAVAEELRAAYRAETIAFRWQKGDLLMLNNIFVAHGRNPFKGARRVLVAMGEPSTDRGL